MIFSKDDLLAVFHQKKARERKANEKPLVIPPYEPVSDIAAEFHARRDMKVRLLYGGNQSGKTHTTVAEVVNLCRTHPGTRAWACTESYEMVGTALYPKYKSMIADDEIAAISWVNHTKEIPSFLRWKNGSHITYKTYVQGRRMFQAAGVDIVQLDEEPPDRGIYFEVLARTSATNGRVIFSLTPLMGKTFVYDDLYSKAANLFPDSPTKNLDIWAERLSYRENRFIPEDEKARTIAMYGEDEAIRRVDGFWTMLSGRVWKEYTAEQNTCDPFPIPREWRRIRAIDYGYEHPTVCLWLALSPENVIFVYREYYKRETLVVDHVPEIFAGDIDGLEVTLGDMDIEATVSDHDAQLRAEYRAHGIVTHAADKQVEIGIQIVNRCFKKQLATGSPALKVFKTCPITIKEAEKYHYKDGTEKPEKTEDDTQDAMRYGVVYFAKRPNTPHVEHESLVTPSNLGKNSTHPGILTATQGLSRRPGMLRR